MSKLVEVTDESFEEEVLGAALPTEVDFWAPWCGPCMMVSPIYDKLSKEYEGRYKFCKINVDENQHTAMKYQSMSMPMQMFFVDGQKVDEILCAVPEHTIRTMVDGILQSFPTDEKGRLKVILTSWTEHNKQHSEKLRKWTEKAINPDTKPIYHKALEAAKKWKKPMSSYPKCYSISKKPPQGIEVRCDLVWSYHLLRTANLLKKGGLKTWQR